jgi:hypothetical protein
LALSGKTSLEFEPKMQPRFYTAMVAEMWRGKTAANEQIGELLDPICIYNNKYSVDSGPALVTAFSKALGEQKKLLLSPDEIKDVFEKSKESANGKSSMFGELLKLFENNKTGHSTMKDGDKQIENAHLALIGGATPKSYENMWMKSGGGNDGLQSRFTVVGTDAAELPLQRRHTDTEAAARAVTQIARQIENAPAYIRISASAWAVLEAWWAPIKGNKHANRLTDIVKRLMVVLAVTTDTATVSAELMRVGVAFGTHVLACRERFNPEDAMSHIQAFEHRIERCLEKRGEMTRRELMANVKPTRHPGGYTA